MPLGPPPGSLIDDHGHPSYGVYRGPIANLNAQAFVPPGQRKPVASRRLKRWLYVGAADEHVVAGGALVDIGLLGKVFVYAFNRKTKKLQEYTRTIPFARGLRIESNGLEGKAEFVRRRERFVIESGGGETHCRADLPGLELALNFRLGDAPLACVSRVGYAGFNYTLKRAGMTCRGRLSLDGQPHDLGNALAVVDLTVGCLARETFWNWAAGGGHDEEGRPIGINLVAGVNETGVTENAFWVGEELVKVDTVEFNYETDDVLKPWRIRSFDHRVDLTFRPEGERQEHLDVGFLASRFHQPFGTFDGQVVSLSGTHCLRGMHGFTEEHFARW